MIRSEYERRINGVLPHTVFLVRFGPFSSYWVLEMLALAYLAVAFAQRQAILLRER